MELYQSLWLKPIDSWRKRFLLNFGYKAFVVKLGEYLPEGNSYMAEVVSDSCYNAESIVGELGQVTQRRDNLWCMCSLIVI